MTPIAKLAAARHQLETATAFFLQDMDPISAQSLACGAGELLDALAAATLRLSLRLGPLRGLVHGDGIRAGAGRAECRRLAALGKMHRATSLPLPLWPTLAHVANDPRTIFLLASAPLLPLLFAINPILAYPALFWLTPGKKRRLGLFGG